MKNLIDELINRGWLKKKRYIEVFRKIERTDFLPADIKHLAKLNEALPIGYSQTISQPLVVAFMIEKLSPGTGDKILDIGSGSGWTTAILAEIVGKEGRVIALEIVPELKEFGEKNVSKYNFVKKGIVKFICQDGSRGYPEESPYDKILVSASTDKPSLFWLEQLRVGGRMVVPINNSICLFIKKSEDKIEKVEFPGFVFVPLVSYEK